MDPALLPGINASLNGLATILLVTGVVLVKKKKLDAHRKCMMGAFGVSAVFLVLYPPGGDKRSRITFVFRYGDDDSISEYV